MCESNMSFTCDDYTTINTTNDGAEYPKGCLTLALDKEELIKLVNIYKDYPTTTPDTFTEKKIYESGSGKFSRAEEIVAHAKSLGVKKIGITGCAGQLAETRQFINHLKGEGIESYCVICKIGTAHEYITGLPENFNTMENANNPICPPVFQAYLLEREQTELNVIVGLCRDGDSLFIRHSKAPTVHLLVKPVTVEQDSRSN